MEYTQYQQTIISEAQKTNQKAEQVFKQLRDCQAKEEKERLRKELSELREKEDQLRHEFHNSLK